LASLDASHALAASDNDHLEDSKAMQILLTAIAFVYPCDVCGYFTSEYVSACPVPSTLFYDYLYDMKACIQAKVKTIQYDKYMADDCLPEHISRLACYKRAQLDTDERAAWGMLIALAAQQADGHKGGANDSQDPGVKRDAIRVVAQKCAQLYRAKEAEAIVVNTSSDELAWAEAMGARRDQVDQFVRVALE